MVVASDKECKDPIVEAKGVKGRQKEVHVPQPGTVYFCLSGIGKAGKKQVAKNNGYRITVLAEAPEISTIADQSILEYASLQGLAFTIKDPAGSAVTCAGSVTASSSDEGLVPVGNVSVGGTAPQCLLSLTPAASASGTVTMTLQLATPFGQSSSSFVLIITSVDNDPPTIRGVSAQSLTEDAVDAEVNFTIADSDNALTCAGSVTATSSDQTLLPPSGVEVEGTGLSCKLILNPAANLSGAATVTLSVTNGTSTVTSDFALTVTAVNDAPTVSDITNNSTSEDTATIAIAFDIDDEESSGTINCGDDVTGTSSNQNIVADADIEIDGSGLNCTVTVTPMSDANGSVTITVTVNDGTDNGSDSFNLTVSPVNDPPVIDDVANQTTDINTATSAIAFTISDVDDTLDCEEVDASSSDTIVLPVANITLAGGATNCTVTMAPASGHTGTSTVTLTVSDGTDTDTDTFTLTVSAVSDMLDDDSGALVFVSANLTNMEWVSGISAVRLKSWTESEREIQVGAGTGTFDTTNLVGYWQFNGTQGQSLPTAADAIEDSSGRNHAATAVGNAAYVDGILHQGASFDGDGDTLEIDTHADLNSGGAGMSIAFWMRAPAANQQVRIISKQAGLMPYNGFHISIDDSGPGKCLFASIREDANIDRNPRDEPEIADGTWHHVAFVADQGDVPDEIGRFSYAHLVSNCSGVK